MNLGKSISLRFMCDSWDSNYKEIYNQFRYEAYMKILTGVGSQFFDQTVDQILIA